MQRLIPLYADNCNSIVFFSAQAFSIVLFGKGQGALMMGKLGTSDPCSLVSGNLR